MMSCRDMNASNLMQAVALLDWNGVYRGRRMMFGNLKEVRVSSKHIDPFEIGDRRLVRSKRGPYLGDQDAFVDGRIAVANEEFVCSTGRINVEILALRNLHERERMKERNYSSIITIALGRSD